MKNPKKIVVPNDWPQGIEYEWLKVMPTTKEEALEVKIQHQKCDIELLSRFLYEAEQRNAKLEQSIRVANILRRSDQVLAKYRTQRLSNLNF